MRQQTTRNKQQEGGGKRADYGFRKLVTWQKADDLASEVFKLSKRMLASERWLAVQLLRAVVSVPANIAEGSSPATAAECVRFLEIASRSLNEVDHYLHFMEKNGLLPPDDLRTARGLREETGRLLFRLIQSVREKAASKDGWQRGLLREDLVEYHA